MNMRQAIEDEARRWLGTPYHSHARVLGIGVDCAQLPIAVYSALGLIPELAPKYAADWHMHHSEEQYVAAVLEYAVEITMAEVQQGDLILWRFGRAFSHGGIVTTLPRVIHALIGHGVEFGDIDTDPDLVSRPTRCFSVVNHGR